MFFLRARRDKNFREDFARLAMVFERAGIFVIDVRFLQIAAKSIQKYGETRKQSYD